MDRIYGMLVCGLLLTAAHRGAAQDAPATDDPAATGANTGEPADVTRASLEDATTTSHRPEVAEHEVADPVVPADDSGGPASAPVAEGNAVVEASSSVSAAASAAVETDDDEEPSIWDQLDVAAFADAYYLVDWGFPDDPALPAAVSHRAFDSAAGFGLAFAGLDVRYTGDNFGATVDLRFGSGAERLIGNPTPVLSSLKQAFASWTPAEPLTFDLGLFDTLYGGEVADSWRNLNYTRGALYYLMQPFYHVGLRGSVAATDQLTLTAMVVNGTNNPIDNNLSPHIGLQGAYAPIEEIRVSAGYYTGAGSSGFGDNSDPTRNGDWEHFFDVVLNAEAGPLTFVLNGDAYVSGPESGGGSSAVYWGASGAVGLRIFDELRLAYRGEVLQDPDQYIGDGWDWLTTHTMTIDVRPVENVILRLDNRLEYADVAIFARGAMSAPSSVYVSTVLGAVVTTSP